MSNESTFRAKQYLPQVVVATTLVVVLPVVVVWLLLVEGVISSPWVSIGLAMALSLGASVAGNAYWKRRSGHGDLLFSEILLWGWLRRLRNERRLASAVGSLGAAGAEATGGGSAQSVERQARSLRQMAVSLDAQDPYTDGHSRRVALHAAMIARRMGMSREEVAQIQMAAAVHDVGKLRIPPDVLNKPTALTAAEFEIVKHHVDDGAEIVSGLGDPALVAMVRHHHERFDGAGYPAGFVGEESPVGARVIAVADTFDALTSERPYRRSIAHKQALEIIRSASGTQLDPVAVRAFLKCYSGKRAIALWTALLVVSPQRVLAMFGGGRAPRPNPGSAAVTIAIPAALAAVVATAVGTSGTLGAAPDPARFAQRESPPVIATAGSTGTTHHAAKARDPHARSASTRAKQATAGIVLASAGSLGGVGAAGGATAGSGAPVGGGGGSGSGGSPGGSGRGGSHGGSGGHHGKPTTKGVSRGHPPGSGHPGGGSGRPATPPTDTSGSRGGTGGSGGAGGGGSGGGGAGGGTGGGGGGNGGNGQGNGGGNPGGSGPQSKQACMNGGWLQFGFTNQGLCIAFVNHALHASLHG